MAETTEIEKAAEITPDSVAESLGLPEDKEKESDGYHTEEGADKEADDSEEEAGDGAGGDAAEGDEEDGGADGDEEDTAGESDEDAETASGGKDGEDSEGGEEEKVDLTPEHQVGAGVQKFLADNIPADRLEEGMGRFQKAMQIIAHQMNGDYEGYWPAITPSLEQAAIDNPEVFIDTLAPLYEKVLYGAGRMLTPENRRAVENMEISEEMALKMQQNEHKLSISQRNIDIFKGQKDSDAKQGDVERRNNEVSLAVRETLERLESEHPNVKGLRDHVAKELADVVPENAAHATLIVENAILKKVNNNSEKNRQRGKKPLRSNKTAKSPAPKNNPDAPHTADEVAQSLGVE